MPCKANRSNTQFTMGSGFIGFLGEFFCCCFCFCCCWGWEDACGVVDNEEVMLIEVLEVADGDPALKLLEIEAEAEAVVAFKEGFGFIEDKEDEDE